MSEPKEDELLQKYKDQPEKDKCPNCGKKLGWHEEAEMWYCPCGVVINTNLAKTLEPGAMQWQDVFMQKIMGIR